jgi:hypothetical protein
MRTARVAFELLERINSGFQWEFGDRPIDVEIAASSGTRPNIRRR